MSAPKYTPGPWEVVGKFFDVHQAGSCEYICQSSKSQGDRREANAHLIAVAPELLEIAEDALPILDVLIGDREEAIGEECEIARDLRDRFRAITAKARAVS